MSNAPQSVPAVTQSTVAAGPQPAQDVPGVGAGLARPAALYVHIGGKAFLASRLDLRVPRACEHEVIEFPLVPTLSERDLYYDVAWAINDALVFGGAR